MTGALEARGLAVTAEDIVRKDREAVPALGPGSDLPAPDDHLREFSSACTILYHIFGADWAHAHLIPEGDVLERRAGGSFFGPFDSPKYTSRVIYLAETVFNLRSVPGVDRRIDRARRADDIRPTVFELTVGRHLLRKGIPFEFHPGEEREIDIISASGRRIPVEAKLKRPETALTLKTVVARLTEAKRSLGKDAQGIVFVSVPEEWVKNQAFDGVVEQATNKALRSESRAVAGIVWYWETTIHLAHDVGFVAHRTAFARNAGSIPEDVETALLDPSPDDPPGWVRIRSMLGIDE